MSTTTYESLLPEILPMVYGCPDTYAEKSIRSAVIELCEKAAVYQQELDPVTTVANVYEYDFEPPRGTVVHKILWVTHEGKDLEPISTNLIEQRKPDWRNSSHYGKPEYYIKQSPSLFWLVPVPSTTQTSSTIMRAQLKPTHSSTACSTQVMDDYRDTIINGALFRLLRTPSQPWTDLTGAQVYASMFSQGIVDAERRARHADEGIARRVTYRGVGRYGSWRSKHRYGKGG
tara:strand:+ start:569 stop:1261 length:693 start_codon:yes stop_codon:yes gene_type:complete